MTDPVKDETEKAKEPWELLGFDTFEAYVNDQKAKIDEAKSAADKKQAMLDLQATEIGELRKLKTDSETKEKSGDTTEQAAQQTQDSSGSDATDELDKMNLSQLRDSMTPEEEQELDSAYKEMTPEQRQLVTSDEAKAEYLRQLLRRKETVPDSFFGTTKRTAARQEQSLKSKIATLFSEAAGSTQTPDVPPIGVPGLGKTATERQKAHYAEFQKSQSEPVIKGGALLDSLREEKTA